MYDRSKKGKKPSASVSEKEVLEFFNIKKPVLLTPADAKFWLERVNALRQKYIRIKFNQK